jgi:ribonucleoside-diphosphate reductase alpha chain
MGIADMFNQLGMGYDSGDALATLEKTMSFIANRSYMYSSQIAKEKGPFNLFDYEKYSKNPFFSEALSKETRESVRKNGLRNAGVLSIAPTGTISNISVGYVLNNKRYLGVSSGIEPVFALYYTRRSESFGKSFKIFHPTVQAYIDMNGLGSSIEKAETDDALMNILPEHFFKTAHKIDPLMRVKIQGTAQRYIDHSISSTVNLSEDIEPEVISNVYIDAWKHGLKGITIYREGSRYPILSTAGKKSEFAEYKDRMFKVRIGGSESLAKGDDVIMMPDGRLTTVYHAMKSGVISG